MYVCMYSMGEEEEGEGREGKGYLQSSLREDLVLLQYTVSIGFVRDFEEGYAFDLGHF